MRIASIDIGSNTVLLLIAEVSNSEIIPILNMYRMPRISSGLSKSGFISEKSIEKLFEILAEYKAIINEHDCKKTIVNGTQALRVANNAEIIKADIKKRFDFDLNIVTGETEGLYSFKGALSTFSDDSNYTMIDIGGASTEIVYGNSKEIYYRKSFPIGVVTVKEKFLKNNPPSSEEIKHLNIELENIFDELFQLDLNNYSIISVAGTPTTLSALKQGLTEYSESKIEKSILSKTDLENFISGFSNLTYDQIKSQFAPIITGREDVIFSGTMILFHLISMLKQNKLFVSGRGLRYGALL